MENEIDLEKKIKELDNILFKMCQSAQTVHMLTKPQAFYDNIHKQALGYQNPFYLKKAQRIKPTLYDGIVMSAKHVATPVIDDEETLIFKPSDASPIKIEAPKELPKVSLVNESLKKLKFHLVRFDNVVKIRTTPDARTEGKWGFEHTKAIFNNEIIPFLKSLKDIFNVFDRDLLNEIMEVQTIFDQMDTAVQQSSVDKQCLEIAKKQLLLENDRLLQQIMSQDVLLTVMNSMSLIGESVNMERKRNDSCDKCFNLEAGLLKSQNAHNDLLKKTKNVELENSVAKMISENEHLCNEINHVKQGFKEQFDSIKKTRVHTKEQSDSLIDKLNLKSAENEDLKAQIQDKVFVITSLKNDLRKLKGKEIVDIAAQTPSAYTIVPEMLKLDLKPLAPRLLQNREAHINYLQYTQEQADILRGIELLVYVRYTCPNAVKLNEKKVDVTPKNKVKKVRIENKVEAQPSKVNKKNSVVEPIRDVDVKHSLLNANSEPICATCKKSIFDGVRDMCHVFTEVGLKWKPTGRTFTIVGNSYPLTRFTSANVVPPKKTTSDSVRTQKPELKVYSKKPKNVKNVDITSSSSLVMTGTVIFGNDHIARIMGYGDYQLGNVTISRVYYVEELGHNLFSVGQFCDADLEVAFRKNTCFIRNLEGVDLLSGSRDTNLYTISLDDMLNSSLIYLLSKASKTKSWLWHRRLSHLNFGKSKKSSHQPKVEDTNQEKLYLLHMDLTKDEALEGIIKCIKNIQVRLNATVRNVRTYKGTEFVNETLREFYENVVISHQTSVSHTPQQNGVVERRNRTLVEASRTISGLVPNPVSQQPCIPSPRDDWDRLFQPMFDEYFTPLSNVVSPVQEVVAPRAVVLAESPVSTSID
ncbi:retrovirus-related pol polyprotein from transposon TNT 1-94 [Tanacetum coccineum]